MVDLVPVVFNIILTVVRSGNPVIMLPFYFTTSLGCVYLFDRLLRRR